MIKNEKLKRAWPWIIKVYLCYSIVSETIVLSHHLFTVEVKS